MPDPNERPKGGVAVDPDPSDDTVEIEVEGARAPQEEGAEAKAVELEAGAVELEAEDETTLDEAEVAPEDETEAEPFTVAEVVKAAQERDEAYRTLVRKAQSVRDKQLAEAQAVIQQAEARRQAAEAQVAQYQDWAQQAEAQMQELREQWFQALPDDQKQAWQAQMQQQAQEQAERQQTLMAVTNEVLKVGVPYQAIQQAVELHQNPQLVIQAAKQYVEQATVQNDPGVNNFRRLVQAVRTAQQRKAQGGQPPAKGQQRTSQPAPQRQQAPAGRSDQYAVTPGGVQGATTTDVFDQITALTTRGDPASLKKAYRLRAVLGKSLGRDYSQGD